MLGFAEGLIKDESIKQKFEEPDDFADDLVIEGELFYLLLFLSSITRNDVGIHTFAASTYMTTK